jgi:hypothetical protein
MWVNKTLSVNDRLSLLVAASRHYRRILPGRPRRALHIDPGFIDSAPFDLAICAAIDAKR